MNEKRLSRYRRIYEQLEPLIRGRSPNLIAAMSTACAILHAKMPHHSWTGFYFVAGDTELHVGPYQGPVACQTLKGEGVCLAAVQMRLPVVVPNVDEFPDHIPCDPRTKSEIAIPLLSGKRPVAVLDIDSTEPAAFSDEDIEPLMRILSLLDPYLEQRPEGST